MKFIARWDAWFHNRALRRHLAKAPVFDARHRLLPLCALNHRLSTGAWPKWHNGWIRPDVTQPTIKEGNF